MSFQKILDVTLALNASKKREKLNALENLTNLLDQGGIVENLHKNTNEKNNQINWEILFIKTHNAILSLVDENNSKSKSIFDKHLQIIQNVILKIVQKSVHQKILLIDSNLLVSSILTVYETDFRIKFLGSLYLNIFNKFIITEKKNWAYLKEENWLGIKNICKKQFNHPLQGAYHTIFLEILTDVIRCSSKNCLISHNFLDLFDYIKDIFLLCKRPSSNYEIVLLHLTNTLCLQLSIEFRFKVCEFMESIFDYVIAFHEIKKPEKNILIYHFFMTTLNIHNPDGTWDYKTVYAFNKNKWKCQLKKIFYLCQEEVKIILKNYNESEIDVEFLDLFVNVNHLISSNDFNNVFQPFDSEVTYEEPNESNKRKCSIETLSVHNDIEEQGKVKHIKLDDCLSNLQKNLQAPNRWFWLKYLELLLQKYPLDLGSDYCQFVEILYCLVCDNRDTKNKRILLRCLCSLLNLENTFETMLTNVEIQKMNEIWNMLAIELLRSLHADTYCETHLLLRCLIGNSKVRDCGSLIKLYCNQKLSQNFDNFKTLHSICQNCIIPVAIVDENRSKQNHKKYDNVRIHLLRWLLQGQEKFPCKELSNTLITLISRLHEEEIEGCCEDILISSTNINDFCKLITRNYKAIAFIDVKFVNEVKSVDIKLKDKLDGSMKSKLFELLADRGKLYFELLKNEALNYDEQLLAIKDSVWFCELICHLISHFECISEDATILIDELEALLYLCSSKCLILFNVKVFDLNFFSHLYNTDFHVKVKKKIREPNFINVDFLKMIYEFFENYYKNDKNFCFYENEGELKSNSGFSQLIKNSQSIMHFQNLTKHEKLIMNSFEFLCQYVIGAGFLDYNHYQLTLVSKIIDCLIYNNSLNINCNFHLQLVLRALFSFSRHNGITDSILNSCMLLIQSIFRSKFNDSEVIIITLQILKDFTTLVHKSDKIDICSKYLAIINEFKTIIFVKKNCGAKTIIKFIECLAEIAKADLERSWEIMEEKELSFSVGQEIVAFLEHPYLEIKLTAAQQLGCIFTSCKNMKNSTIIWQENMLNQIFEILRHDSALSVKENETVFEYFEYVISSVSLIAWANIICLSNYWRKKALFNILHLSFLQKFNKNKVADVIKFICKELKINCTESYISSNFSYLLHNWCKNNLHYQDFPFYLLGYNNAEDFIRNRYELIVTTYMQSGQLDIIEEISTKLNKSTEEILKDCHSVFMAFILPSLNENIDCEIAKKAQKLKRFIDQELTPKKSMQWLTQSLDNVIYYMIRNLHDPVYLNKLCEFFGNFEDDKTSLSFKTIHIIDTLDNMSTSEGEPFLGKIALEVPSMIENILLSLQGDVEKAIIYEDKIFALYKYIFFVEALGTVTDKKLNYYNINTFIIRDVVYTLSSIIRNDKFGVLSKMSCEGFLKISESYLKKFNEVLGEFLPAITTALIPLAQNFDEKALKILNFLICKNYSKLQKDIACLDPFPSDEVFDEINCRISRTQTSCESLKHTIEHFIKAGKSFNSGCRIEGLKNLRKVLSKEKKELKKMYDDLKTLRGFSEDCKKSLLHRCICVLVELTSDINTSVKIEAVKCLGELGPSDLTTLVLRPENDFVESQQNVPAQNRLIKLSLSVLSDLLISNNYNVKKATSKALYALLSTTEGKKLIQSECDNFKMEYFTPFISSSSNILQIRIKNDIFIEKLGNSFAWTPNLHEKWVANLLECLLLSLSDSTGVISSFIEIIKIHWQFAESIFPVVLDFIISSKEKDCCFIVNHNISAFFEQNFSSKNKSIPNLNKTSVRCMVNVVDYIRTQRNYEGSYQRFGLNIDYLNVAKAALYCSAYFTSIFYAELWFEEKSKDNNCVDINMICELFPTEGFALTEILRECHSKIGNSDGIHGCGYMHILDETSEIQHYQHLKNWSLSMLHHDIQMSHGNFTSEIGLLNSLESSGMLYTLNNLMKTSVSPEIGGLLYKCAARLRDWSLLDSGFKTKSSVTDDYFDKCFYFSLKAFHEGDYVNFQNETYKSIKIIINEFENCSLESSKNLYQPLSELQCLKELEEFAMIVQNINKNDLETLFLKWNEQDDIKCSEFKLIELVLTNRTIIIQDILEKSEDPEIKTILQRMLCEVYYKLTVAARKEKKYETAIRTLTCLNNLKQIPENFVEKIKLEKCKILWERGDKEIGRFLLRLFLKRNEITGELKAKSLRIYGDWMAKTKSENSREIIENYYLQSIARSSKIENRIDCYTSLAKFADCNYEQLQEYLSSPLFELKQNLINTQQDLASELRQELGLNQNREKRMAYQIAAKQSVIDENEIKNSKLERDSYLNLALKYYLLSLKEGEKYNLVIFRVVSLWLSNSSNPDVIQQLQKILHHIPSYKFLCLLPQLVPRMADVCLISNLMERILQEHPHHSLPLLFALYNSYEDMKYNGEKNTLSTPRVLAAKSMLEKFQKHQILEKLISEMHCFSCALIELANHNHANKNRTGCPIKFPECLKIKHISNLTSVPVPSLNIPYNKNCIYDDIITVHKFEENYHLVGGINLPKRIKCIGSDGISRSLLIKGKDDLRQDAVMQQVFTIMNSLLYQNSESNKRKLVIRTYKVVPLSQRSGVIEWCENTQPLSLYLTGPDGKSGAHKKFYPNDLTAFECRCIIKKIFSQPQATNEDKLRIFLDVCRQIRPVFHHFFIEKFHAPGMWFERRLAYIHSVATSSMIGYILGIGDRHVYNILIDNSTAEVIHIDLGIAFEQGKTLPTPETVPFRLTRDIVDGMGLSGVEGDFRLSCIKTMEVLRENKDTVLTLLEVLLYDPLYTWTITPEKAYSMQNQTETSSSTTDKSSSDFETNKIAERALIRLKQKLEGTEAGFVATNVEGQVNYLIQQARDPTNLCRLFHGWQAYLLGEKFA